MKLKASKTQLFREKIQFLGHMISEEGLGMVPSYLDRILDWPTPTTTKEFGTLLGFFGYYRQ